jgi:PLP dependent protein
LGTVLGMYGSREEIAANVATVKAGIARACARSGRDPHDVLLVAAAKTLPAAIVRLAVELGVSDIGENYVKELRLVHDEVSGARWHYIGALQTNTAHHVAALADVVQTVSGDRATERLARRAAALGQTIGVLIEVDFTRERSGIGPEGTVAFADRVAAMEGLELRGLMTVPPLASASASAVGREAEAARPWFRRLRLLRDEVRENHPGVVDLSMGMSLDYQAAVEEGATMVRIGTALFGPRTP